MTHGFNQIIGLVTQWIRYIHIWRQQLKLQGISEGGIPHNYFVCQSACCELLYLLEYRRRMARKHVPIFSTLQAVASASHGWLSYWSDLLR